MFPSYPGNRQQGADKENENILKDLKGDILRAKLPGGDIWDGIMGCMRMCFCVNTVSPQVARGLIWLEFKVCVAEWQDMTVESRGIFPRLVHKIICNSLHI